MADQKLTQLTALATLSADDLFYVVDDPAGAANSRKMAASVLDARYLQDAPSDGSTYGRNNAAWVVVGAGSLPVADTQTIVKGSVDATKLLRFEVDGFTAGATRVLTPPNQDTTLAGQNFTNTFSVNQTFTALQSYAEPAPAGIVSHKFYAVDPVDPDSKLWNWNIATSDNAGSARNNVVMNWGYNVAAGGGPEDTADGSFYQQIETFYQPGATAQFEWHWDFFLSGGADPGIRPLHLNMNLSTGLIDYFWYQDTVRWFSAHDGQFEMLNLTAGATEAASSFTVRVPAVHIQPLTMNAADISFINNAKIATKARVAGSTADGVFTVNDAGLAADYVLSVHADDENPYIFGFFNNTFNSSSGFTMYMLNSGITEITWPTTARFNVFGLKLEILSNRTAIREALVVGAGNTIDGLLSVTDSGFSGDKLLTIHADDDSPYGFAYFNNTFGASGITNSFSYYLTNAGVMEIASPGLMKFKAAYAATAQLEISTTSVKSALSTIIRGTTTDGVLTINDAGTAQTYVASLHADDENVYGLVYFNNTFASSGVTNSFTYFLSNAGVFEQASPAAMKFKAAYAGPQLELQSGKIGFFAVAPVVRQTFGAATAGGTYGATEQTMLQTIWDALRAYGLGT